MVDAQALLLQGYWQDKCKH